MTLAASIPLTTGIIYLLFSLFILQKLRGRADRWVYSFWMITTVMWHFMAAILYLKPSHELTILTMRIGYTGVIFIPVAFFHFCAVFLNSATLRRWLGWCYATAAISAIAIWVDGLVLNGYYTYPWSYYPCAGRFHPLTMGICILQLIYFMRHLTLKLADPRCVGVRREQIRLIRRGIFWYSIAIVDFAGNYGYNVYPPGFIASLICLGHIAYAIVRHQLMDIQVLIRRTVVFSIASTVLACLYVAVLFGSVHVFNSVFSTHPNAGVLIACAITALCHPLIRKVQRFIDGLFGQSRLNRADELMKFSSELGSVRTVDRARALFSEILEEAFRPTGFVIYRSAGPGFEEFARSGLTEAPHRIAPDHPWARRFHENALLNNLPAIALSLPLAADSPAVIRVAAPLASQGRLLGFMLLGEKRSEEPYTEQDLIHLRILANQAAVALERLRLIKEVGAGLAHEIKTPLTNIVGPAEESALEIQALMHDADPRLRPVFTTWIRRMDQIVDQAHLASQRIDAMQQLTEVTPKQKAKKPAAEFANP